MRYNYASADCGARVIGASKDATSTSSVLSGNRDTYMLSRCATNPRHVIIELCQQVRVDAIAVSNFEYFSSTFAKCRLSVPVKAGGWEVVGEWEGRAGRGEQTFALATATTQFTKVIRVDFDRHHGSAYYCPITSVKVFGKTMMEEYVEEEDDGPGELRVLTTARTARALITVPTALPLATVMEFAGRCQAGTTAPSERSTENVFKAINDRLNRLERSRADMDEVRAQLEGLGRIIVNMAGREHRAYRQLPMSESLFGGGVGRCEFYSVILTLCVFLVSVVYVWGKSGRRRDNGHRDGSHQDRHNQQPQSSVPLDLPNSDYLGMARTPVDSVDRSPVSPTRRRSSIKP